MKFHQLYKIFCGTKLAIEYNHQLLSYTTETLFEDVLFFEEIKNMEVTEIWYSTIYNSIVFKVE